MSKLINLTGQKFGRLTALKYIGNRKWLCKCDCGEIANVDTYRLRTGGKKSCGCINKEKIVEYNKIAGGQIQRHKTEIGEIIII